MNNWFREYIGLALKIDEILKRRGGALVESYRGPSINMYRKQRELRSPRVLLDKSEALIDSLFELDIDINRKYYIEKQLFAMQALLMDVLNEEEDIRVMASKCLDINIDWIDDKYFEEGIYIIDDALGFSGSIDDKYVQWKRRNTLRANPNDKVILIKKMFDKVKLETEYLLDLPELNIVEVDFTRDLANGAKFNYLGDYKSRVTIGIQQPLDILQTLRIICHESYPGHHTEYCLKEKRYGDTYPELMINTVLSPSLVISEGIAETAFDIIFDEYKIDTWLRNNIYREVNIITDDINLSQLLKGIGNNSMDQISNNVILMMHDKAPRKDIYDYVKRYTLESDMNIHNLIKGFEDKFKRLYALSYYNGKALINNFFKGRNKLQAYKYILTNPLYPSMIEDRIKC